MFAALAAISALLVQCAGTPPAPAPTLARPPGSAAPGPVRVHPVTAAELGSTWHPGCPVEPGQLRRVEVTHVGLDGQIHQGELVVHEAVVADVLSVFDRLYRLRYPIEKIRTADHYPAAADELSMEDDNTSAFNCRGIPGSDRWSWHAYGRAIDLNPRLNPSVHADGGFEPTNAAAYLDRTRTDPGLIHHDDPPVTVFTAAGWRWGGYWQSPVDYQHFELPDR